MRAYYIIVSSIHLHISVFNAGENAYMRVVIAIDCDKHIMILTWWIAWKLFSFEHKFKVPNVCVYYLMNAFWVRSYMSAHIQAHRIKSSLRRPQLLPLHVSAKKKKDFLQIAFRFTSILNTYYVGFCNNKKLLKYIGYLDTLGWVGMCGHVHKLDWFEKKT